MTKLLTFIFTIMLPGFFYGQELTNQWTASIIHSTMENALNNKGIYPDISKIVLQRENSYNPYAETYKAKNFKRNGKVKNFKDIVKESWGITYMDTLYINSHYLTNMGHRFIKTYTSGQYKLLFAQVPHDITRQKELKIPEEILESRKIRMGTTNNVAMAGIMFGAIGGGLAGAARNERAKEYIVPIIIDAANGVVQCFNPELADILAEEHPDITSPKSIWGEYDSKELVDYLEAINNRIKLQQE